MSLYTLFLLRLLLYNRLFASLRFRLPAAPDVCRHYDGGCVRGAVAAASRVICAFSDSSPACLANIHELQRSADCFSRRLRRFSSRDSRGSRPSALFSAIVTIITVVTIVAVITTVVTVAAIVRTRFTALLLTLRFLFSFLLGFDFSRFSFFCAREDVFQRAEEAGQQTRLGRRCYLRCREQRRLSLRSGAAAVSSCTGAGGASGITKAASAGSSRRLRSAGSSSDGIAISSSCSFGSK